MIINFLGKGGSGKTSLATQAAFYLQKSRPVLAIDADHNMDFAFNVAEGDLPDMNHLGSALPDVLEYVGLSGDDTYTKAFREETDARFSFGEDCDDFTATYTHEVQDNLHLMSSGPQTERVLYGKSCSHFLSTPLKVYLPLLELENDGVVLLDEKAGADGASTGIVSGVDVGVVVSEPSVHGTKTANQIAELLEFFGTPYIFVGNKVQSKEDKVFLKDQLDADPGAYIESNQQIKRDPFTSEKNFAEVVEDIYRLAQEKSNGDRLERTIEKFERNASFQF